MKRNGYGTLECPSKTEASEVEILESQLLQDAYTLAAKASNAGLMPSCGTFRMKCRSGRVPVAPEIYNEIVDTTHDGRHVLVCVSDFEFYLVSKFRTVTRTYRAPRLVVIKAIKARRNPLLGHAIYACVAEMDLPAPQKNAILASCKTRLQTEAVIVAKGRRVMVRGIKQGKLAAAEMAATGCLPPTQRLHRAPIVL